MKKAELTLETAKEMSALDYIKKMEKNTYLLPNSWSKELSLDEEEFTYKTYVGVRGKERYINICVYIDGEQEFQVDFRRDSVKLSDVSLYSPVSPDRVDSVIKAIYKEKMSFEDYDDGIKSMRKEIAEKKRTIRRLNKDINTLNQSIKDALILKEQ